MSWFSRLMLGVWVSIITMLVMQLVNFTWPELASESTIPYGVFFTLSVLVVVSIWTSE